jgi:hypothetical protein
MGCRQVNRLRATMEGHHNSGTLTVPWGTMLLHNMEETEATWQLGGTQHAATAELQHSGQLLTPGTLSLHTWRRERVPGGPGSWRYNPHGDLASRHAAHTAHTIRGGLGSSSPASPARAAGQV